MYILLWDLATCREDALRVEHPARMERLEFMVRHQVWPAPLFPLDEFLATVV